HGWTVEATAASGAPTGPDAGSHGKFMLRADDMYCMREIRTDIEIDAPPRIVWDVLTDLDAYGEWNPQTTSASGVVGEGETIDITVEPAGRRPVSMSPRVTAVVPRRRLEWVGTVVHPRLFEARHEFELEPLHDGGTRLYNDERIHGLLARFVVDDGTIRDYEAMNRALAERAASMATAEKRPA
ncbi:SRPBCC family protein, partial [Halobium palmae]